jgi:hypothetical protein
VQVSDTLKGPSKDRLTFMQFTGTSAPSNGSRRPAMMPSFAGLPAYRVGEEVVLFLYPTSNVGFTSPVGGLQGKFLIQRLPGRPATVVSEGGNPALAVTGSLPSHLTAGQQALLRHPGAAMDYKSFAAAVRGLARAEKQGGQGQSAAAPATGGHVTHKER